MKKNHPSDGILVFDRYYGRKPVPVLLAVGRVLFCAFLAASAMLYIFSQYELDVPMLNVGLYAGCSAALFSVIFIFVRRRYAIPVLFLASAALIWLNFERFWEDFSYFVDAAMLLVEGRFLKPRGLLIHETYELTSFNPSYRDGLTLGAFVLCVVFGLLCAASSIRRIRILPVLTGFVLLCVPMLLSESLEFNMWFIPFALMAAAAVSVSINYRDGLAVVRSGGSSYRLQVREEEKNFLGRTASAGIIKRCAMRLSYYSKYATTGFYCAAVFSLVFCIGWNVFEEGSSLDYRKMYNMITSIGEVPDSDDTSESDISDYFASPDDDSGRLDIVTPGSGEGEVLRVTFTGDENIYLRGDIGVDLVDNGWTSPVHDNAYWETTILRDMYRPSELLILDALMKSILSETEVSSRSDISIEYLEEMDVVFLPAYTLDLSYFANDNFDVYGDHVVRVSDSADNYINTVKCQAMMLASDAFGYGEIESFGKILSVLDEYNYDPDMFYSAIVSDESTNNYDILKEYNEYVNERYTEVPRLLRNDLEKYLDDIGFDLMLPEDIYVEGGQLEYSQQLETYLKAKILCDYLSDNYTYSLGGENTGDDVILQFLRETKRGHCSLYASAMTLLLRTEGIPARYCTGFSIYPDSINGDSTVLKEKNLHAWVEVYIEDIGWLTFDPTSAAVSRLNSGNTTQHPDVEEETKSVQHETKEHPTVEGDTGEYIPDTPDVPPTSDDTIPSWLIFIVAAAIILVAVIVFVVVPWIGLKKKADMIVQKCSELDIAAVYGCIIDVIALCGISPTHGQLPTDFYRTCDKHFSAGMEDAAAALEAVAFGGTPDEDMSARIAKVFTKVYAEAVRRSDPVSKFRIRKNIVRTFR